VPVEYRILGNLEVAAGGRLLDLGGGVQRRLLAALLLRPNQVVPMSRLITVGWDAEPPATAVRQVRNRVAALRSILTRHGGLIDTADAGYRLRVAPGQLDSLVFDELVAGRRFAAALALWRGRPFDGLGVALSRDAAAWEDRWLGVVEAHADCSVADLTGLVAAYPLRERLIGRLMAALDRAGRRADAIRVYDELAARLADRLGIDPSPELRALRGRLLGTAPEPAGPTPRQLPADVAGFTGRAGELGRLDRMLSDAQAAPAVVISAISGTAGVGKTALALHWGHRVRDKFPDGQLYVNLCGFSPTAPVRPVDALGGFLRALGVPAERVPAPPAAAAALYQDLLVDRRLLLILDNAADAEQVQPLLPASTGSVAVVTSRSALPELPASHLLLEVLDPDEAVDLLARLLGQDRVAAVADAVAELARLCGYLPLALRIAAANLIDRPDIAGYVAELRTGDRLEELAIKGDPTAAVRGAFALSYGRLDGPAQRMFRLLGLAAAADVDVLATASLAAVEVPVAQRLLDRLAGAHLVEQPAAGRYALHDLLRWYARELADRDPERDAALERLLDHYVHAAAAADDILAPRVRLPVDPPAPGVVAVPMPDRPAAIAWVRAECGVLVSTVQYAYDLGFDQRALQLATVIDIDLDILGYWSERQAMSRVALAAAQRGGHDVGLGFAYHSVAGVQERLGDIDTAIRHYRLAVDAFDRAGDQTCVMFALINLAAMISGRCDPHDALPIIERAHALAVELGPPHRIGRVRNLMAEIRTAIGDHEQALVDSAAAMRLLLDDPPNPHVMVDAWFARGALLDLVGRHDEAAGCFRNGLDLARTTGNRLHVGHAHEHLGDNLHRTGRLDEARRSWRTALAVLEELGVAQASRVRTKLLGS
jgi:DNA-binding SARP family transcriptional activator